MANATDFKEELYICAKCGYCRENCPSRQFMGFETYSARGKILILKHMLEKSQLFTRDLVENYYICSTCGYCKEVCPTEIDLPELFVAIRSKIVEEGQISPKVRDFLECVHKYGNPWGELRNRRDKWAEDMRIMRYKSSHEFLYYVGCVGSYDTRAKNAARALSEVLLKSGVSLGILGAKENCDGNEVNMLGEKGLFELLAKSNIKLFKDLEVKKIVSLSPHAYNVMKNDYPKISGDFKVTHYTQILRDLIRSGKLELSKVLNVELKITYHDPCFLGRWNEEYDAPREVLSAIKNVKLVEMGRNRKNAFCCGGGSGNFYTDFLGGTEKSPNRIRIREAYETGAEILAVSCPTCLIMFEDALRAEGLEEKMKIKDISEIVKDVAF